MDLSKLAGGAVAERVDLVWQELLHNVMDPNTDPKKPRKLTIELTFTPGQQRDMGNVTTVVKAKLEPATGIESTIMMGMNSSGEIESAEYHQTQLFEDEVPKNEGIVSYINKGGATK